MKRPHPPYAHAARTALPWLAALLIVALALIGAAPPAAAHGGGPRVTFQFGVYGGPYWHPYWDPYWGGRYGPRWWGLPPVVYVPSEPVFVERTPPVYVEREQPQAAAPAAPRVEETVWWYWCPASRGYYPYVKECAGGFQRVPPQPVPASPAPPARPD